MFVFFPSPCLTRLHCSATPSEISISRCFVLLSFISLELSVTSAMALLQDCSASSYTVSTLSIVVCETLCQCLSLSAGFCPCHPNRYLFERYINLCSVPASLSVSVFLSSYFHVVCLNGFCVFLCMFSSLCDAYICMLGLFLSISPLSVHGFVCVCHHFHPCLFICVCVSLIV